MIQCMYKIYKVNSSRAIDDQWLDIMADFGTPGVSPGYAGSVLGISRQAVDQACQKGALRACKIYEKNKHVATLIDTASIDAYRQMRQANGGRIPYRALQPQHA